MGRFFPVGFAALVVDSLDVGAALKRPVCDPNHRFRDRDRFKTLRIDKGVLFDDLYAAGNFKGFKFNTVEEEVLGIVQRV